MMKDDKINEAFLLKHNKEVKLVLELWFYPY